MSALCGFLLLFSCYALCVEARVRLHAAEQTKEWSQGYVAICAVAKDQHEDIREWIEYHKWLGFQKIYLYDNNSTSPLALSIADYMTAGLVEYTYFTGVHRKSNLFKSTNQAYAYRDCNRRFGHRHRFLAFIDVDEFIVFTDKKVNLTGFFKQYESYGGLAMNWVMFGSSGHQKRPTGGVLGSYTSCLPLNHTENRHVKVVANTAFFKDIGHDPHTIQHRDDKAYTVNENFQRVQGPFSKPTHSRVALYHYVLKSREDYQQKMERGSAAGNHKRITFFENLDAQCTERCTYGVQLSALCCGGPATQ